MSSIFAASDPHPSANGAIRKFFCQFQINCEMSHLSRNLRGALPPNFPAETFILSKDSC
jgi:hypothetical protein